VTPSQALQRVVVRMLFDPSLVARVYAGHTPPPLSSSQAAMLRAQPRGGWATDPYRCSRTLQALLEEYPAAAAITGVKPLHAFFRSPTFHEAIMQRRVLAAAFGDWLIPQAGPVAAFEQAVASLRRRRPARLGAGEVCSSASVQPVSLLAGTVTAWQAVTARLGVRPLERLVDPSFLPLPVPALGPDVEHWLLEVDVRGQVQLGGGSAGLNGLLLAASAPIGRASLACAALELGADSVAEARGLIDDLIVEGLLVGAARLEGVEQEA
jgi:hypothetical protein